MSLQQRDRYEPGAVLLVLSTAIAYRETAPGVFSRRPSRLRTGEVVPVHSDAGRPGPLLVVRKGRPYRVSRSDVAPAPTGTAPTGTRMAHALAENASLAGALQTAQRERDQARTALRHAETLRELAAAECDQARTSLNQAAISLEAAATERDAAGRESERLRAERDALRARLDAFLRGEHEDRARLAAGIAALRRERDEALTRQASARAALQALREAVGD